MGDSYVYGSTYAQRPQSEDSCSDNFDKYANVPYGESAAFDVNIYSKTHPKIFFGWILEVAWLVVIGIIMVKEVWGACPTATDLMPVCRYCFTWPFTAWTLLLMVIWSFNLYVYVLLVSRSYSMVRFGTFNMSVPRSARTLFAWLCILLICTFILGAVVLVMSDSCSNWTHTTEKPARSTTMFWTVFATVVGAPFLVFLGRCFGYSELRFY